MARRKQALPAAAEDVPPAHDPLAGDCPRCGEGRTERVAFPSRVQCLCGACGAGWNEPPAASTKGNTEQGE